MKVLRLTCSILLLTLTAAAFAQSDAPKPVAANAQPAPTEGRQSFEKMKTLAGNWTGKVTTVPPSEVQNKDAQVTIRVTSMGNAFLHEIKIDGRQDDPITMFYLENDRLTLTHYCDAGNRPRMTGKMSPDGKIDFDFLDISGDMKFHMHRSAFTILDANHHIEEWTFMVGDKPVVARFDLERKN